MKIGDVVDDRYRIEQLLGEGGMGVVYRAHDTMLDKPVAIKTLPPACFGDLKAAADLKHEVATSQELRHRNICATYNLCISEDEPFILMEYVDGDTLGDHIFSQPEHRCSEPAFHRLATQILDAVQYAHECGVIHRDLSSGNIMVLPNDEIRVMDFGITAKSKETYSRTTGHPVALSVHYASPELINGEQPAPTMDVYSLGCVFYEMLSGNPPFVSGDVIHQQLTRDPAIIRSASATASDAVLACLEKDPRNRPQSAAEIRAAFAGAGTAPVRHPSEKPAPEMPAPDRPKVEAEATLPDSELSSNLSEKAAPEMPTVEAESAPPDSVLSSYLSERQGLPKPLIVVAASMLLVVGGFLLSRAFTSAPVPPPPAPSPSETTEVSPPPETLAGPPSGAPSTNREVPTSQQATPTEQRPGPAPEPVDPSSEPRMTAEPVAPSTPPRTTPEPVAPSTPPRTAPQPEEAPVVADPVEAEVAMAALEELAEARLTDLRDSVQAAIDGNDWERATHQLEALLLLSPDDPSAGSLRAQIDAAPTPEPSAPEDPLPAEQATEPSVGNQAANVQEAAAQPTVGTSDPTVTVESPVAGSELPTIIQPPELIETTRIRFRARTPRPGFPVGDPRDPSDLTPRVLARMYVLADGTVAYAAVAKMEPAPPPVFQESIFEDIVRSMREWKFRPGRFADDTPAPAWLTLTFSLATRPW